MAAPHKNYKLGCNVDFDYLMKSKYTAEAGATSPFSGTAAISH